MIKAYHSTRTVDALEKILAQGAILPGINRLSEEALRATCGKDTKAYDTHFGPNPIALRAMNQLLDEFIRDHAETLSPKAGPTALRCSDILAGDAGRVFLSAYRWTLAADVEKRGLQKTGFAFDAEDLVRKGAAVRPYDLYGGFDQVLKTEFRKGYASTERAMESIASELSSMIETGSLYGDEAIAYLHKGLTDHQILYELEQEDMEVVWDGPLPIELAIEEWRNGRKSKLKVHSRR